MPSRHAQIRCRAADRAEPMAAMPVQDRLAGGGEFCLSGGKAQHGRAQFDKGERHGQGRVVLLAQIRKSGLHRFGTRIRLPCRDIGGKAGMIVVKAQKHLCARVVHNGRLCGDPAKTGTIFQQRLAAPERQHPPPRQKIGLRGGIAPQFGCAHQSRPTERYRFRQPHPDPLSARAARRGCRCHGSGTGANTRGRYVSKYN